MLQSMRWVLLLSVLLATLSGASACRSPAKKSTPTGAELYAGVCARCHGPDGAGGPAVGSSPAPRNFRDHAFQVARTDDELKQVIRNGKGVAMPAFGTAFDEAGLAALVAQVRSFDAEKSR